MCLDVGGVDRRAAEYAAMPGQRFEHPQPEPLGDAAHLHLAVCFGAVVVGLRLRFLAEQRRSKL